MTKGGRSWNFQEADLSITRNVNSSIMSFAPALAAGMAAARDHGEAANTDFYAAQRIREVGQRLVAATERIVELEAQLTSERSRRLRAEAVIRMVAAQKA